MNKLLPLALCLFLTACGAANTPETSSASGRLIGEPISQEVQASERDPASASESSGVLSTDQITVPEEDNLPSIKKLLTTALLPLGETAYVWGGGWNEEDTAAGIEARTIGISPAWKTFADGISSDYDHQKYRYQIHDGLDCSGYVGWVIYNVFETEDGKDGYVFSSTEIAKTYASHGWGDYVPQKEVVDWKPGDVASMSGHVWLCLGACEDGSVLLIHSSPPGVRLCGTTIKDKPSDASRLARELMQTHYPAWYDRFPDCEVSPDYLSTASQMRWNEDTMPDAAALQALSAEEVAALLFP